MPKIFISYRRDDTGTLVGRIYDRLANHFGRDALFLDIDDIPIGIDFRQYLDQAVSQCDVLLAIVGNRWLRTRRNRKRRLDDPGDIVRIEIEKNTRIHSI